MMSFKNRKKSLFLMVLAFMFMLAMVAACGDADNGDDAADTDDGDVVEEVDNDEDVDETDDEDNDADDDDGEADVSGDVQTVNLWSFTDEVPNMMEMFLENNPDYAARYDVDVTIVSDQDGAYMMALDQALEAGGSDIPHIFTAESAFALRYTQGTMAHHALPYTELGIDVDGLIDEAAIASYAVEIGTRDGEVVGLGFQATGGAMIYRRSIAESVFGTDDPDEIADIVGPGWDRFLDAAREIDEAGYSAVSGAGDLWQVVRTSGSPWVVDGELNIDPEREAFMDVHSVLYQEGLMNDADAWSDAWFADMSGAGERETFAFFGPAWLINFVMAGNAGDTYGDWAVAVPPTGFFWGGTWLMAHEDAPEEVRGLISSFIEWVTLDSSTDGLQYLWANGLFDPESDVRDVVASGTVMDVSDGEVEFLGGQNMFEVFAPAGDFADGTALTEYDLQINDWFIEQSQEYAQGTKTREEALNDFKQAVADNTAITVNFD